MQFTIASLQVVIIAGIASLQLAAGTPINIGMAMDKDGFEDAPLDWLQQLPPPPPIGPIRPIDPITPTPIGELL
ncbi:hypothetical protein C8J57DRAFT_1732273 [Mycena rebaudengoi]|nr:hypothetical protein C8J57DRAFT_1732273 [Mycena rebaudengoi]